MKISLSRCFTSIGYAGLQALLNTSLTKDRLVGFEVTSLAISVRSQNLMLSWLGGSFSLMSL